MGFRSQGARMRTPQRQNMRNNNVRQNGIQRNQQKTCTGPNCRQKAEEAIGAFREGCKNCGADNKVAGQAQGCPNGECGTGGAGAPGGAQAAGGGQPAAAGGGGQPAAAGGQEGGGLQELVAKLLEALKQLDPQQLQELLKGNPDIMQALAGGMGGGAAGQA